jgi:predicted nucleotidyltransferase
MFDVPIQFISLEDLIVNKQAAGRTTDLEHLQRLKEEKLKPKT